jgi:hypothetical protein
MARSLINPGIAAGLATLMWRIDENLCRAFWRDLNDQTNMFQPVTKLRERLFSNKMSKAKLHRGHLAAITIKAWNAVRDGKQLGVLRALEKDEPMPMIK